MEKHDLSERSASDQENHVEDTPEDRLNREVPDPDADRSHAERAAIVGVSGGLLSTTDPFLGPKAFVEA